MKKAKLFTLLVALMLAIALLAACNVPTHTVNFTIEGQTVAPQTVSEGSTAAPPKTERSGYLAQWYLDGEIYDFTTPVLKNIELVGKWVETIPETVNVTLVVDGVSDAPKQITGGTTFEKPTGLDRNGYDLVWYNGASVFDFNTKLVENVTLTAVYLRKIVGSGTPNDPYKIFNADDLAIVFGYVSEGREVFASQEENLELDETFVSIGTTEKPFRGGYNGKGMSVRLDGVSLFGTVSNAEIKNLSFSGMVEGEGIAGALAAVLTDGTVSHIWSSVDVSGSVAGGLVGRVDNSFVYACMTTGIVTGAQKGGGIVAELKGQSTISECAVIGEVEGDKFAGGIAAEKDADSIVFACYASAAIIGDYAGGLVGSVDSALPKHYISAGFVSADQNVISIEEQNKAGTVSTAQNASELIDELNWSDINWKVDKTDAKAFAVVTYDVDVPSMVSVVYSGAFSDSEKSSTVAFGGFADKDILEEAETFDYEGKVFEGWYLDEDCTAQFNAALRLTTDTKLFAKYIDVRMLEYKWTSVDGGVHFDLASGASSAGRLERIGAYEIEVNGLKTSSVYFTDENDKYYRFYYVYMPEEFGEQLYNMSYQALENGIWTGGDVSYMPSPENMLGAWSVSRYGATIRLLISMDVGIGGEFWQCRRFAFNSNGESESGVELMEYFTYIRTDDDGGFKLCGYTADQDEFYWGYDYDQYFDRVYGFWFFYTQYESDAEQLAGSWLDVNGEILTVDTENGKVILGGDAFDYTAESNDEEGAFLSFEQDGKSITLRLTLSTVTREEAGALTVYGRHTMSEYFGSWGSPDGGNVLDISELGVVFNGIATTVSYALVDGRVVGSFSSNGTSYSYYLYNETMLRVTSAGRSEYYAEKSLKDLFAKDFKNLEMTLTVSNPEGHLYKVGYGGNTYDARIVFLDDPELMSTVLTFVVNDDIFFLMTVDGGNDFFYLVHTNSLGQTDIQVCCDAEVFDTVLAEMYSDGAELSDIFLNKISFNPDSNTISYKGENYALKTDDYEYNAAGRVVGIGFLFGENERYSLTSLTRTVYIYDTTVSDEAAGTESFILLSDFEAGMGKYIYWGGREEIVKIEAGKVTVSTSTGSETMEDVEHTSGIRLVYQHISGKYIACAAFPYRDMTMYIQLYDYRAQLTVNYYYHSDLFPYGRTVYGSEDGATLELTRNATILLNNVEAEFFAEMSVANDKVTLTFTVNDESCTAVFETQGGVRKATVTAGGATKIYTEMAFDYNDYLGVFAGGSDKIEITAFYDMFGLRPFIALQAKGMSDMMPVTLAYKSDAEGNLVLFNAKYEIIKTTDGLRVNGANFYPVEELTPFEGIYKSADNKALVFRAHRLTIENVAVTGLSLEKRVGGGFDVTLTYAGDVYTGTLTSTDGKNVFALSSGDKRFDFEALSYAESELVGVWNCGDATVEITVNTDMMSGEADGLAAKGAGDMFGSKISYSFDDEGNLVLTYTPFMQPSVRLVYKDGKLELTNYYEKAVA